MNRRVVVVLGTVVLGITVAAAVSGRGTALRPNLRSRKQPTVDTGKTST